MIKTAAELIEQAQQQISCVDIPTAKKLYEEAEDAVILDVREADSAAESKLTDSVNISRGLVEMKVPKLCPDADTLILTHCGGGGAGGIGETDPTTFEEACIDVRLGDTPECLCSLSRNIIISFEKLSCYHFNRK